MSEEITQNSSSDDEASSDEDKLHIADEEETEETETAVPRDLQEAIDAMNLTSEKYKREHKERMAQIKAKTKQLEREKKKQEKEEEKKIAAASKKRAGKKATVPP